MNLVAKCKSCNHFYICRGGCHRNRVFVDEQNSYDNYLCEGFRMFFDATLDRMKSIVIPNS